MNKPYLRTFSLQLKRVIFFHHQMNNLDIRHESCILKALKKIILPNIKHKTEQSPRPAIPPC